MVIMSTKHLLSIKIKLDKRMSHFLAIYLNTLGSAKESENTEVAIFIFKIIS